MITEREKDYNLIKDEYLAMRSLENDRNVIIKPLDKGSSIAVWDRLDYLAENEKQLSDSNNYKEVKFLETDQVKLVEKSNSMFEGLKKKTFILEKEKIYFKPVMKEGKLYIKDTAGFLNKLKDLGEIAKVAILVTDDVVGLYPSMPHTEGLEILILKV